MYLHAYVGNDVWYIRKYLFHLTRLCASARSTTQWDGNNGRLVRHLTNCKESIVRNLQCGIRAHLNNCSYQTLSKQLWANFDTLQSVLIYNSIMMLVKFLTSANQKHWIWSCDESGLSNPRPRLLGDEVVVSSSLIFRKMDSWNVIRK